MDNRVVHFEICAKDPDKTMKFFGEAFAWKFQQASDDYWMVTTGDDSVAGINGGILRKTEQKITVANSVGVEDIDQSIKDIKDAGGKIVKDKFPIPGMGWMAYFSDPDGYFHGLWQEDSEAK